MTLTPLLTANFEIQLHVGFALAAVLFGPLALLRRSRDRWHRLFGGVWVLAMLGTALSSFFINDIAMIGPFSPIHVLSLLTLWTLTQGLRAALRGQWRLHGQYFRTLYVQAIGLAGLFTFLPGRTMNRVAFPDAPLAGFLALACLAALTYIMTQTRIGHSVRRAMSNAAR